MLRTFGGAKPFTAPVHHDLASLSNGCLRGRCARKTGLCPVVAHKQLGRRVRSNVEPPSGGDFRPTLEMLMRGAVVALREGSALARLPLAGGRAAAGDAAVEGALLDLLLDEGAGGADAFLHRPGDLRLHGDREVAADVLEKRALRLREVERIGGEPLPPPLAGVEDFAAELQLRVDVDVGGDQILD